jgi:hypothetical protein
MEGYPLVVGGPQSVQALFDAGKYNLSPYCLDFFLRTAQVSREKCRRDILIPVEMPPGVYPTADEVLEIFEKRKLLRPTIEHALRFGITYPEAQCERPYVFLHDFWTMPGNPGVIVLCGNHIGRRMDISSIGPRWNNNNVFLGVQQSA